MRLQPLPEPLPLRGGQPTRPLLAQVVRHQGGGRPRVDVVVVVHRADPIPIDVWVTRIRAASFELAYEVHDDGHVYARAASTLVPFDLGEQRPRRLSASEREWLGQWLEPRA